MKKICILVIGVLVGGSIAFGSADLAITDMISPAEISLYEGFSIEYTIQNQGQDNARGPSYPYYWQDIVYLSHDSQLSPDDVPIQSSAKRDVLPGNSYSNTVYHSFSSPTVSGNYYLILSTDDGSIVVESNEGNNTVSIPIRILQGDLTVIGVDAPPEVSLYEGFTVTYTTQNQGEGIAKWPSRPYEWSDALYLSRDAQLSSDDVPFASRTNIKILASGASYSHSFNYAFSLPLFEAGDYYLIMKADDSTHIPELDESNNTFSKPIRILQSDLTVIGVDFPAEVSLYEGFTVTYTTQNQGEGIARWPSRPYEWSDALYLSYDEELTSDDIRFAGHTNIKLLAGGASYSHTFNYVFGTSFEAGNYYLIMKTDDSAHIPESNEGNNFVSLPIRILEGDLAATGVDAPAEVSFYEGFTVTYTVTIHRPKSRDSFRNLGVIL